MLLLLIFEQLGTSDSVLRWAMLLGPLVLYAGIGLCVPTQEPLEFFAAGRRVPAGYTGLGIGVAAMGATGIVAMTGVFFLIGFDALCLMIGGLAGFVIMAVHAGAVLPQVRHLHGAELSGAPLRKQDRAAAVGCLLAPSRAVDDRRRAAHGRLRRRLAGG